MNKSCMKKTNTWPEYRRLRPRNHDRLIQSPGNRNDREKHTGAFHEGPEGVDGYSQIFIVHIIIERFSMVSPSF
jgi:hypothetical protein